jgi:hypothetical protein
MIVHLLLNCVFSMEVGLERSRRLACRQLLQSGNGWFIDALVGGGQIFRVLSSCVSLFLLLLASCRHMILNLDVHKEPENRSLCSYEPGVFVRLARWYRVQFQSSILFHRRSGYALFAWLKSRNWKYYLLICCEKKIMFVAWKSMAYKTSEQDASQKETDDATPTWIFDPQVVQGSAKLP